MDPLLLEHVVADLSDELVGARLEKIFLYDAHDLALRVRSRAGRATLLLTVDPEYPAVARIRKEPDDPRGRSPILEAARARLMSGIIVSVAKLVDDRVVVLSIARPHGSPPHRLIAELLPRSPALYLVDPDGIVLAADGAGSRRLRPTHAYVDRPPPPIDDSDLRGLPRRLADEVRARAASSRLTLRDAREQFENACRSQPEPCLYELASGTVLATATPFSSLPERPTSFDSVLELSEAFYHRATVGRREAAVRARLEQALRRRHRHLERARDAARADVDASTRSDQDRSAGEMLLAYQSIARVDGDAFILPAAADDGSDLRVPMIDPRQSVVETAQLYFARYKRRRRGAEIVAARLATLGHQLEHVEELIEAVLDATLAELPSLETELRAERLIERGADRQHRPSQGKRAHTGRLPSALEPRKFERSDGASIWVGRSSRGNDHLTFELAAAYDFWLHADAPGSHVILRNPARLSEPDPTALLDAAALAAWHSRLRNETGADVHWTRRSSVQRIPGAPAGRVRMREHRTVRVDPRRAAQRFTVGEGSK